MQLARHTPTSPSKSFSIIVADQGPTAVRTLNHTLTLAAINQNGQQVETVIVASDRSTILDEPSAPSPASLRLAASIDDAVRNSRGTYLIIADRIAAIDQHQFQWMVAAADEGQIQTLHERPPLQRRDWLARLVYAFLQLIHRWLFRHGCTPANPSLTVVRMDRKARRSIASALHQIPANRQTVSRLLSSLKIDSGLAIHIAAAPQSAGTQRKINAITRHGSHVIQGIQGSHHDRDRSTDRPGLKSVLRALKSTLRFSFNEFLFPAPDQPTGKMAAKNSHRAKTRQRQTHVLAWLVLAMITCFVLTTNMDYPLFEPDETRNAQIALNILDSGQWMSLQLDDQHYWDKPPLMAWLTAISYHCFGVSETTTRLPGVLLISFCTMFVCAAGKRLVGFRAAWIGALLVLLSCSLSFSARFLTMDAALTTFTTATMLSIYIGSFSGRIRPRWWMAAGVFFSLALLAKGPVIAVILAPPILAFAWLTRQRLFTRASQWRQLSWFLLPCLLIAGPWYLATLIGTPEFATHFLWKHHVMRYSAAFNHQQPVWYYLPVLLLVMFPASQLFLPFIRFLATKKLADRNLRTRAHGFLLLVAAWVLLFFSLSQSKLPTYIFPMIPAICLLMGAVIDIRVFRPIDNAVASGSVRRKGIFIADISRQMGINRFHRRLPKWLALNMVGWIVIASLAIQFVLPGESESALVMVASAAAVALLAAVACYRRSNPYLAWSSIGLLAVMMTTLIVHRIVPGISCQRSIQSAVRQLKTQPQWQDARIVYFARDAFATEFGLPRQTVRHFPETSPMRAALALRQDPHALLVSTPDHIEMLRQRLPSDIEIEKSDAGRHVYLISLNSTRDADGARVSENEDGTSRR